MHLQKHFGSLENLKGKKIAMTWAYSPSYGKPLSVPQGIITLMTRFGMNVTLAHPEGYDLVPDTLEDRRKARQGIRRQLQASPQHGRSLQGLPTSSTPKAGPRSK